MNTHVHKGGFSKLNVVPEKNIPRNLSMRTWDVLELSSHGLVIHLIDRCISRPNSVLFEHQQPLTLYALARLYLLLSSYELKISRFELHIRLDLAATAARHMDLSDPINLLAMASGGWTLPPRGSLHSMQGPRDARGVEAPEGWKLGTIFCTDHYIGNGVRTPPTNTWKRNGSYPHATQNTQTFHTDLLFRTEPTKSKALQASHRAFFA